MFPWAKILRFGALTFAGVVVGGCVLLLSAYARAEHAWWAL
jgi:hypothetical protein